MRQRVHLITLGVDDLERTAAFYDALGWVRVPETPPPVIAYDLLGATLGLYQREVLAKDLGYMPPPGSGSLTLSCNTRDRTEVEAVLAQVKAAGGKLLRDAHEMDWGGYGGAFQDPEGHVWEVIFNPFSPLGADESFQWAGA